MSVPQIVVVVMRTSASSGPTSGIGFSSSTIRPGSANIAAFMRAIGRASPLEYRWIIAGFCAGRFCAGRFCGFYMMARSGRFNGVCIRSDNLARSRAKNSRKIRARSHDALHSRAQERSRKVASFGLLLYTSRYTKSARIQRRIEVPARHWILRFRDAEGRAERCEQVRYRKMLRRSCRVAVVNMKNRTTGSARISDRHLYRIGIYIGSNAMGTGLKTHRIGVAHVRYCRPLG
jgi:hypothetical protein